MAIGDRTKVAEKEFVVSTELLMRQLLKLDGIEAEGEAKMQRKAEVCNLYFLFVVSDFSDSACAKFVSFLCFFVLLPCATNLVDCFLFTLKTSSGVR